MNGLSRKLAATTLSVVMASVLLGCPLLKKKSADAGADDDDDDVNAVAVADAATVTVEGSGAVNEKDVLRYAKEEKLADEPALIAKDGTKVRTFPGGGPEVATLAKGTAVLQIARYFGSGVLIVWDGPGGKTMGWVSPKALAAPTPTETATPTTTATAAATPTAPTTVRPTDAGATAAAKVDAGATAAAKVDAGATSAAKADAGTLASPTAAVDAGAAAGPKATQITFPPDAKGACPTQFIKSGPICKRRCMIDAECPRGTYCVKDPNPAQILKVCSTDKAK